MKKKAWTIMIYMAGDNNLAVDMAYAMEQIRSVVTEETDNLNLMVYYDGNSPSIPTLYCDFSEAGSPKYVRSFMVPDKLYPVPAKENENAADPRSVKNFVDWCVNKVEVRGKNGEVSYGRRADRYALIFSGHSLGFADKGLFKDETSGKSMKIEDLFFLIQRIILPKASLEELAKDKEGEARERETTVLVGQWLDVLGFDSCVMGMLEVGYQFKDVARTMLVSEGSVPSAGWTYAKLLGGLARGEHSDSPPAKVAEHFVKKFIETQDKFTVGGVSVDLAAWDMDGFSDLAAAFNDLSGLLYECFGHPESPVYKQLERVVLMVHWKCQSYMYDQNVDLGDFCTLLRDECETIKKEVGEDSVVIELIQQACDEVLKELHKTVILCGFSGGEYQYSNGVSVFFPWSSEGYQVSRKNYEDLWFFKDNKWYNAENGEIPICWAHFLDRYLNDVTRREPASISPADAPPGSRFVYRSGIRFDEGSDLQMHANTLPDDESDSDKIAGTQSSKLAGTQSSKLAGTQSSKLAGTQSSKLAGTQSSKLAGTQSSKLAGTQSSKLAGTQSSKLAGTQSSKLAGTQSSKLAGTQSSKLAGTQSSKLAGTQSSKLAGASGVGDAFFDNLKLWKNIEKPYDISGFSRRPQDDDSDGDER